MQKPFPDAPSPGPANLHAFSFFNALTIQLVSGPPLFLYVKSLGTSSLTLGVVAALGPLLMVLQMVGARLLKHTGFRSLMLGGWGLRTLFITGLTVVPIWPGLSSATRLIWVTVALLGFNAVRGIATSAWLPWVSTIIPAPVRGRFFAKNNAVSYIGYAGALGASAFLLGSGSDPARYSMLFCIGAVSAVVGMLFVGRVRSEGTESERRESTTRLALPTIFQYLAFRRLLAFTLLYALASGSLSAFTVEYLVQSRRTAADMISVIAACTFPGSLFALFVARRFIDDRGALRLLGIAALLCAIVSSLWAALSFDLISSGLVLLAGLHFFIGFANACFGLGTTHMSTLLAPKVGQSHYLAVFMVVSSIGLGLSPAIWGALLQALEWTAHLGTSLPSTRYSIYFAALALVSLLSLLPVARLKRFS